MPTTPKAQAQATHKKRWKYALYAAVLLSLGYFFIGGDDGLARGGLLVRHLILPGGLAGTAEVVRFLGEEISRRTYLNLMSQYRPCYRADERPELGRRPTMAEFRRAHDLARQHGLKRLD